MKHDVRNPNAPTALNLGLAFLLVGICGLTGCFSSTKVVSAGKSVVYNGSVYNVSNVGVFTPRTEAVISPTETIPLTNVDKDHFNAILKQHKPLTVRQVIQMDERELVYQIKSVDSWSALEKMSDQFESAQKQLTKFLADEDSLQLKLK